MYDVDEDGRISAMDLRKSMMSVGHRMTDADIRMMIQVWKRKGKGEKKKKKSDRGERESFLCIH